MRPSTMWALVTPPRSAAMHASTLGSMPLPMVPSRTIASIWDMVSEGMRLSGSLGSARIPWVQADALRLPFADESFDAVTVGYGLRNLADVSAGLREMHRVLRPGGRLVALDFGKPARAWLRRLFFAHLRFHLPWMGRWSCGDPEAYSYIVDSLEAYPAQRGVCELMVAAGYRECGFEEFFGGTMAINFGRK